MKQDKKMQKISNNKVRNWLMVVLIMVIVIPIIVLGFLSYYEAYNVLAKKLETTAAESAIEIKQLIGMNLKTTENQVKALSESDYLKKLENVETLKDLLENAKKSNPNASEAYYGLENGEQYMYPEAKLPENYDPRKRPWYEGAMKNPNEVYWTEPFRSASTGKMIITVAKATMANGKATGVVGADINLEYLQEYILKKKFGETGYIYVTNLEGRMIAHPDQKLIDKDDATKLATWKQIKSNKDGFATYEFQGKDKFCAFSTDEQRGWKIIGVMDEEELSADTNIIRNFTLYAILFGLILAIVIAFLISRKISKPLEILKEAFYKAANGDLTVKAQIGSKDEFGEIGDRFNEMMKNIHELSCGVKTSAKTVLEASDSLGQIITQTVTAADEVAKTIEGIASSSNEQAKDTENGFIKVNDLAEKIEMLSNTTNHMNDLSKGTDELSNKGLNIVRGLIEKSGISKKSATQVNDMIIKVDERAKEIGGIIDTISQIAEQTNLLALNAAIESARAGEHGKGFSVVAEEVRKLAEESSKAAEEIKQLIAGVQNQSSEAVDAMNKVATIIRNQEGCVDETSQIFNEISGSIKVLIGKVSDIKGYGDEMIDKKDEIVAMIGNISAASEETSAATQQVSASTEEQLASMEEVSAHAQDLKNIANRLEEGIDQFKLEDGNI
ncbi:MAG: methyl-accepting chemotaxis protein [Marinisporobacter sp.]|jgi:methyl-accepting chemotaxis protein|nr:methyl-accepting chemotaxis protein [Marinisporobacter sp.]